MTTLLFRRAKKRGAVHPRENQANYSLINPEEIGLGHSVKRKQTQAPKEMANAWKKKKSVIEENHRVAQILAVRPDRVMANYEPNVKEIGEELLFKAGNGIIEKKSSYKSRERPGVINHNGLKT